MGPFICAQLQVPLSVVPQFKMDIFLNDPYTFLFSTSIYNTLAVEGFIPIAASSGQIMTPGVCFIYEGFLKQTPSLLADDVQSLL